MASRPLCPLAAAGFRRWLSSAAPAPRVCVVGSGPAGFYTAQHILKVPAGAGRGGEGRDPPLKEAFPALRDWGRASAGSQPRSGRGCAPWGAARGSPDPAESSWAPLAELGTAAPALPLRHPGWPQACLGCCEFSPSDFSRMKQAAEICLSARGSGVGTG